MVTSTVHTMNNEDLSKIYPIIDQDKCCGDALCVKDCIRRCISMNENNKAQYKAVNMECFQCGHCIAVCPKNAITFNGIDSNALVEGKADISSESIEHFIRMRRSIRDYKDDEVPHDEIIKSIETASYAPTGGNKQEVSWVLVSKDKMHELSEMCAHALGAANVDNIFQKNVFISLMRAFKKGRNLISYNAPHVVFTYAPSEARLGIIDSTIALSYLEFVFNNKGIGTCWVGYMSMAANFDDNINKFLGIPDGYSVTGAMLFGYPKLKYHRSVMRKNLSIHTL